MTQNPMSQLADPLLPFAQAVLSMVWPHAKRLHAEHRAGQSQSGGNVLLLDKIFDETLSRLRGGQVDDDWWKRLLDRVGHYYVAPEFLRSAALQEWLAESEVQTDLKTLARLRFLPAQEAEDEGEIRDRLRGAYSVAAGENSRRADGPINVLLAVLVAGYEASLAPHLPMAAMVQAGLEGVHRELGALRQTVTGGRPDQLIVDLSSKAASEALKPILSRRVLVPERSREDIRALLMRFGEDGDLRFANLTAHVEVLRWAARLYASEAKTVAEAILYLHRVRELEPDADTRIVEAWILVTQGDADAALRAVRDIDSPDGRANLFALLRRAQGADAALNWFSAEEGRNGPGFLTGIGWYNVAVHLALAARWEEALNYLFAAGIQADDCPALACLEGNLSAAMLLPASVREDCLKMALYLTDVPTVEGPEADKYRTRALERFAFSVPRLDSLGLAKEARHAHLMNLWLRLTDTKPEVAEEARREVTEGLRVGSRAIHLVPLVPLLRRMELPFDPAPANQYLEHRKRLGGLDPEETAAEFLLAMNTLGARERAELIEREEQRFATVFHPSYLTSLRVEALAQDEQFARAMTLLEERKVDFSDTEYRQLRTLIDANAGKDIRAEAEALYRNPGGLIHLRNLIGVLGQSRDWGALRPRLEELFRLDRNLKNAERLVRCLQSLPTADDGAIAAFLEGNPDLVSRSRVLAEAKAWSLFHLGRWKEAETINRRLLRERTVASDLLLDTNLALQTGDWERFAVIVDREWPRRAEHDSDTLLRLSTLAAESDTTARAMELARQAAEKAPDDPHVLISAASLAFQLGLEEESDPTWLARAAELSSNDGPVWQVDLRKMVEEMIPAQRDRFEKINSGLVRGEIPLHFAAAALNAPLSNILLNLPRRNSAEPDGRRRTIIPIFSGARNPIDVQPGWIVGLDVTSILVLSYLGLLEKTIATVHRIALAPDTMSYLLSERRRARFHQPSRVDKAREVRSQIDHGRLRVADTVPEPPGWLMEEVGRDLAQLLEGARTTDGKVIHPLPIHQLRSFQEEEADLREYEALVLTTAAFARILHERGRVDAAAHERARGYLLAHDRDQEQESGAGIVARPLFLDEIALTYLQDAGLLKLICQSDLDLRVHPSTRERQYALIEADWEGDQLATSLDEVRRTLRDALADEKVFFLPHRRGQPDERQEENWLAVPSLGTFLEDVTLCDAICIDDRSLNHNPRLSDRKGHVVPVLCTLDILHFLGTQGVITAVERQEKLHRLREGSFGLVPVTSTELEARLRAASLDEEGRLLESPEIRAIRQTTMRFRSLDMVQQPLETPFLDRLRLECVQVLFKLWRDEELPVDRTEALGDWAWRNVSPSPLDWTRTACESESLRPLPEAFGLHLALLLQVGMVPTGTRQAAFRAWVEAVVLAPLLPANSNLVDGAATLIKNGIERLVHEL